MAGFGSDVTKNISVVLDAQTKDEGKIKGFVNALDYLTESSKKNNLILGKEQEKYNRKVEKQRNDSLAESIKSRVREKEEYQKFILEKQKYDAKAEKIIEAYNRKQQKLANDSTAESIKSREKENKSYEEYIEEIRSKQEKENYDYEQYSQKLGKKYSYRDKYSQTINEFADKFGVSAKRIIKAMGEEGIGLDDNDLMWKNRAGHALGQEELNKAISNGVRETKRFDTASLGMMFAGMALNRAMNNLTATSREWVGISELMSTAMGITMLPATLDLLNLGVLPLFEAFTSLPEPAQKAIGYLTYALGGLGGVLMVGGQLSLGLQSFDSLLGKITGIHVTELMTKGYEKVKANLGSIAKYAGAAILFSLAFKDGAEGQFVAALGDILMGAGILVGGWAGGVIGAIGFTMKFLGDEDFRKGIWKAVIWGIDTFMWMVEQISTMFAGVPQAIITGNWDGVINSFKNIGNLFKDEIGEAAAEMFVSGDLKSQFGKETGYNKALETYGAKTSEYSSKYGWGETTGVMGTETSKQIEINEEIGKLKEEYKSAIEKVGEFNTEVSKLDEEFAEGNIRQPEYNEKVEELKIKYADSLSLYEIYNEKLETLNTRSEDLATAQKDAYDAVNNYTEAVRIATEEFNKEKKSEEYESTKKNKNSFNAGGQVGMATGATIGATIGSIFPGVGTIAGAAIGGGLGYAIGGSTASLFNGSKKSATSLAVGTNNVPNNGLYYLHEGEAVVPKNENNSGNVTVAPVYYVNVSDKAEFQKMLNDSNRQLVAEITRSVKV